MIDINEHLKHMDQSGRFKEISMYDYDKYPITYSNNSKGTNFKKKNLISKLLRKIACLLIKISNKI